MSSIKLKIKIFFKVIFHTLLGRTRLKAWILRAFSRDYELDSAKLAELIAKPLAKDAPKGDFIASLTSFPARVGILKYALHSIFSQDLRAKRVILVLSIDEFLLDSANCAKSAESNLSGGLESRGLKRDSSFCESKKKQKLLKDSCEAPENSPASWCKKSGEASSSASADFLLEADKRGSPPKSEKAELFGAQGERGGGCSPFCEKETRENYGNEITKSTRDSSPTAQNDKIMDCHADSANLLAMTENAESAESALDSANLSKSQNLAEKIKSKKPLKSFCYFWLLPKVESPLPLNPNLQNGLPRSPALARNDENRDSSPTAQNDKFRVRVAESALDSALLDNLLPAEILAFKKFGLEIMWVEKNLRQYNKIIPILRAFPRENIITLDDDIYYNPRTFSTLHSAHLSNKRIIWAHKARIVPFSAHKIADFFEWKIIRKRNKNSQNLPKFSIFLEGCGGVFYPPNCLYKDAMDSEKFLRLAPKADDIWLWAMALLKGTKIACVKPPLMGDGAAFTNSADNPALWHYNMNGGNDKQMRAILAEYPQILRILAQEKSR